jgi:hypothetical protein
LRSEAIFDEMRVPDHADHRSPHRLALTFSVGNFTSQSTSRSFQLLGKRGNRFLQLPRLQESVG